MGRTNKDWDVMMRAGTNERKEVCVVGERWGEVKMECVKKNRVYELVLHCMLMWPGRAESP